MNTQTKQITEAIHILLQNCEPESEAVACLLRKWAVCFSSDIEAALDDIDTLFTLFSEVNNARIS